MLGTKTGFQRLGNLPQRSRHRPAGGCYPAGTERRIDGSESPLHNTGNHRPVEPYSTDRAADRGDLTNPAQTGEGGEQAELVTPR